MYAEPSIRPARVVVREIHLASEHAADSPCTPVAPRTLTSKPAPVVRGESPRFVARIRPKAASGEWPCTLVPRRPTPCEAPGALRLPGLRVADDPAPPCERAGAVVEAQACSRPAHASHAKPIRERRGRRLDSHAGRIPTLTSKPLSRRGRRSRFCSPYKAEGRIREWRCGLIPSRPPYCETPGCASLTRATGRQRLTPLPW